MDASQGAKAVRPVPSTTLLRLLLLLLLLLYGCQTPTPAPATPTPTEPAATATMRPSATPTPAPTETATRPPTLTPTPTTPSIASNNPETAYYQVDSWSPDGRLLAFRSFTSEDADNNRLEGMHSAHIRLLPYGTFHLLDVGTNNQCEYAKDNPHGLQLNLWHAWLPDGRLMTLNEAGEVVALQNPCDGGTAAVLEDTARPACLVAPPDPKQSCSPDGARLATVDVSREPYATTVINTATGAVEAVFSWSWADLGEGLAFNNRPLWLDSSHLIIPSTDEGPLLVTLDGEVQIQPIAPTFFNQPGNKDQVASGRMVSGTQSFHLLLANYWNPGTATESHPWAQLYHGEDGTVEELTAPYADFSPDGRWLDLSGSEGPVRLRETDPPSSQAQEFFPISGLGVGWSADWSRVGVVEPAQRQGHYVQGHYVMNIYAMPEKRLLQVWPLGDYYGWPVWSPDKAFIAFTGYGHGDRLFVLPVSD